MAFVAAKCTQCGSNIKVDESKDAGICEVCGTPFVTEKVINNYNTYVTNDYTGATVVFGDKDNLLQMVDTAVEAENFVEVNEYASKVLELDPNNRKALFWKGYASCAGSSLLAPTADELIVYIKKAMDGCFDENFIIESSKKLISMSENIYRNSYNHWNQNKNLDDTWSECISLFEVAIYIVDYVLQLLQEKKLSAVGSGKTTYKSALDKGIKCCIAICEQQYCYDYSLEKDVPVKAIPSIHMQYQRKYETYCRQRKALDSSWQEPAINTNVENKPKEGCYIATCVYGSYECPEVLILRAFRDNVLKNHMFGRLFIKCYYATSPKIVKIFGEMKMFNKIFKPPLDIFVTLQNKKSHNSNR